MGEFFILEGKQVPTQKISDGFPSEERVREHFFSAEWETLRNFSLDLSLPRSFPTLFYPGCGGDLFRPLLYLEKCFPRLRNAHFFFLDLDLVAPLLDACLERAGIPFSVSSSHRKFLWKGRTILLEIARGDVFTFALPVFDIYFEHAFRIMKEQDSSYEHRILERLAGGGVVISDSGFSWAPLYRIPVPLELSAYGEMVVGVKKSKEDL